MPTTHRKRGQPTLYKASMMADARKLASVFLVRDEDLAKYWGVNPASVTRWKKKHPYFCKTIEKIQEDVQAGLHSTLHKLAIGVADPTDPTRYLVQPNLSALIFLLTNRYPQDWADKRAVVNNQIYNKVGESNERGRFKGEDLEFQQQVKARLGNLITE